MTKFLLYDIHVINLERFPKKMTEFYDSFKNFSITRIDAFDGNKLLDYNNIKLPNKIIFPLDIFTLNNYKYIYACSFSHIKAIHEAYKLNKDGILICEDDLRNNFEHKWKISLDNIIKNRPKDSECLTLFCVNELITQKLLDLKENYTPLIFNKEGNRNNWYTGSAIYFLTKEAMKKIVDIYIKDNIIDFSFTQELLVADYNLIYPLLKTFHYTKPLFIDSSHSSTINENFSENKLINQQIIKNYFNNLN